MARIRSIHPSFFTDEACVSCSPLARLLYIGLWTDADDQGLFEWKPLQLKMRLLPGDNADAAALLAELTEGGLVAEFSANGKRLGAIRDFRTYQRPKKPNSVHVLPPEWRTYVGLEAPGSEPTADEAAPEPEPVPHQFPTGGEKSPQMEDGGEDVEEDDAAQKLMIGTDALQEFRLAMVKVGGEAKDADSAIGSFNQTLGAAQSGLSPKAMRGFAALGFTKEQLDSFNSGEDALTAVASRIAALSKESEQAAVAEKLGLGPMLPLLREGADGMEKLLQTTRDTGAVMDRDLIAKGAAANQEFQELSGIIDVQLKSAFIQLSDEVVSFTGHIADALKGLNDFLAGWSRWKSETDAINGQGFVDQLLWGDAGKAIQQAWGNQVSGHAARTRAALDNPVYDVDDPALLRQRMAVDNANRPRPSTGGRLTPPPARSGGGRGNREAEQRARRQEQFDKQLDRVQMELLRAWDAEFESIGSDAGYKLQMLRAEHEAKLEEITDAEAEYAKSNGLRGLAKTEADQLRAAQEELLMAEQQAVLWRERQALEEYRFQTEQDASQAAIDLLDIQAGMAITAQERHEAERRILALTLEAERNAQKRELANDPNIDDAGRARLLGEGDKGRQARYDAQGRQSDGARMGRDAVGEIREPADNLQAAADAYAEIQRLRDQDVISEQEAALAKAMINADYQQKRLTGEGTMLDQMASLQSSSIKELAAIGKAAALAQATIDGYAAIQKAWASAPFPANLPAVAITTAMTASNIAAIASTGFRKGGYTGDGAEGTVAGAVHGKEYVFDAASTRRIGRSTLDALRSGSPLIAGLNSAGSSPSTGGMGRGAVTFAPTIDARGAERGVERRILAVLDEQRRSFADDVNGVRNKRAKYRLGGRK